MACEDANSKLVESVTHEDCVGNNLLQIRKLRFGQKAQLKSTRFGQDFEVEVLARFEAGARSVFSADVL